MRWRPAKTVSFSLMERRDDAARLDASALPRGGRRSAETVSAHPPHPCAAFAGNAAQTSGKAGRIRQSTYMLQCDMVLKSPATARGCRRGRRAAYAREIRTKPPGGA